MDTHYEETTVYLQGLPPAAQALAVRFPPGCTVRATTDVAAATGVLYAGQEVALVSYGGGGLTVGVCSLELAGVAYDVADHEAFLATVMTEVSPDVLEMVNPGPYSPTEITGMLERKATIFRDLPADAFPLNLKVVRAGTDEVLWEDTVHEPGALEVPGFAPEAVDVITQAGDEPPQRMKGPRS